MKLADSSGELPLLKIVHPGLQATHLVGKNPLAVSRRSAGNAWILSEWHAAPACVKDDEYNRFISGNSSVEGADRFGNRLSSGEVLLLSIFLSLEG